MTLDPYIQKLIRERMACDLSRPSQFDALALDMEHVTGEHIGINNIQFGLEPGCCCVIDQILRFKLKF